MKKTRFTESQIASILKQADSGMKVEQLCRQHGMSSAAYCHWKSQYGGMEASDAKR
jgi:putative transposase